MPQNRQSVACRSGDSAVVRTLGMRFPPNHRIATHQHGWHQLVFGSEGVMTVETSRGAWVVPPARAVWIPAGFEHGIRTTGRVRLQTLYFRVDLLPHPSVACCVVRVSGLLRELIRETMERGMLYREDPEHAHLIAVLFDQIFQSSEIPLRVEVPLDPRARFVAELALSDLSAVSSMAQLVRGSGASVRTIERLFQRETGSSFGRWLQRARALHALERLAAGDSVTQAGLAVGYDSTSAFIAMFKRTLGKTPGSYFSGRGRDSDCE